MFKCFMSRSCQHLSLQCLLSQYSYLLNMQNVSMYCSLHPCRRLVFHSINIFHHIKGNISLVILHSSIVKIRNQLLCDSHTVPKQHKGTADCSYFSLLFIIILSCFFLFITVHFLF